MKENQQNKTRNSGLRRPSVLGWLHLMRISHRVLHAAASELKAYGLSNAQFDVLTQIGAAAGILQFDLAQRLFVTQGNVTQLIDKMEARGWIKSISKGGTKSLFLTPAGQKLFDQVVSVYQDFIVKQF